MDRVSCPPGSSRDETVESTNITRSTCEPCEAGYYQPDEGQPTCIECPHGHFCPKSSVAPIQCGSVALYCPANSKIVTAATAGFYTVPEVNDDEALLVRRGQEECEAGHACNGGIKTKCDGEGRYSGDKGETSCKIALPGQIPNTNRTGLVNCTKNTFSIGGSDTCKNCKSGEHSAPGSSSCEKCPQHEVFSDSEGRCKCLDTFSRIDGECTCGVGETLMGTACEPCELGKWKSRVGVSSCSRCQDSLKESITLKVGSSQNTSCICPAGTYEDDNGACVKVIGGMSKTVQAMTLASVFLDPGYWRTGPMSKDVRECLVQEACVGGNSTNYCRPGHRGPYCHLCVEGYTKDPFMLCKSCSASTLDIVYTIVAMAALAGLFICALRCMKSRPGDKRSALFKKLKNRGKILFAGAQIISSLPVVVPSIPLPDNFKDAIAAVQVLNLNIFNFVAVGCWSVGMNYYRQAAATTVPVAMGCLILVFLAAARKKKRTQYFTAMLALTYLTLPTLTTIIFGLLPCDTFDDGRSLLRKDYSLSCLANDRWWWEAFSKLMIVVFPVGVPSIYFLLLWRKKERIKVPAEERQADEGLLSLSFLFDAFKPEYWYFEVVETIRRLALTGLLSTIKPGSFTQLSSGLLIAAGGTILVSKLEPYQDHKDNLLAIMSGCQLMSVFVTSFFIKAQGLVEDEYDAQGMGLVLIISYVLIILAAAVSSYHDKDEFIESSLVKALTWKKGNAGTSEESLTAGVELREGENGAGSVEGRGGNLVEPMF